MRTLCLVTGDGGRLSPDEVALAASGGGRYDGAHTLQTHYLIDGQIGHFPMSRWSGVAKKMKSTSLSLKESGRSHGATWNEWRKEAVLLMPAAVFVWLDDFKDWFRRTRPFKVTEGGSLLPPEGGGDLLLVHSPSECDDLKPEALMEGFSAADLALLNASVAHEQSAGIDAERVQPPGEQERITATWEEKMRELADELHRRDLKAGSWSNLDEMANMLAVEAQKRGIIGPRGQLTAANIRRTALQGDRWKRPKN